MASHTQCRAKHPALLHQDCEFLQLKVGSANTRTSPRPRAILLFFFSSTYLLCSKQVDLQSQQTSVFAFGTWEHRSASALSLIVGGAITFRPPPPRSPSYFGLRDHPKSTRRYTFWASLRQRKSDDHLTRVRGCCTRTAFRLQYHLEEVFQSLHYREE